MNYTLSKKQTIFALYRCSHCNEMALNKVTVITKAHYNDKGSGFGRTYRDTMEERSRLADGFADDVMDGYLAELRENKSAKVYMKMRPSCTCPHCGKREPWAMMDISWLSWLAVVGFVAMVIFGICGVQLATTIGLVVGVASVAMLFGWRYLMMMRTAKQIKTCPPLFERDLQMLKTRGLRNREYANMDWEALLKSLNTQIAKK